METQAVLRGVRISAQKGRLVADQVRGMPLRHELHHRRRQKLRLIHQPRTEGLAHDRSESSFGLAVQPITRTGS